MGESELAEQVAVVLKRRSEPEDRRLFVDEERGLERRQEDPVDREKPEQNESGGQRTGNHAANAPGRTWSSCSVHVHACSLERSHRKIVAQTLTMITTTQAIAALGPMRNEANPVV